MILRTPRLELRELCDGDAPFILELLNDPDFISNIGDRRVRDLESAIAYIRSGPAESYAKNGFGLWLAAEANGGAPAGLCGLIRRPQLADVDLGFAFLPAFRGRGLAYEAAAAAAEFGRGALGLPRIAAIAQADNAPSIRLLGKLGFRRIGTVRLSAQERELEHFMLGE